ncbi:MAG: hypothetical protein Q8J64_03805 [Thermodesulfovibrionales bacterium]|nr:hypothetical protein [Thermodesulfovibrionales bacterium]
MKVPETKKLWIGIIVMILLSPIGLLLPELFKAGGAWGEWGPDEIEKISGYVPEGLRRLSEFWKSPFPDYTVRGWEEGFRGYASYIFTGIIGVLLVVLIAYALGKILTKNRAQTLNGKNGNT